MSAYKRKNGEAVAALLAVLTGLALLTAAHWWSVADPLTANGRLLKLGSWMPGWYGIGPYAGKETAGLVGWLVSWGMWHVLLRGRELNLRVWTYGCLAGVAALLVLLWPPLYHAIFGWNVPSIG